MTMISVALTMVNPVFASVAVAVTGLALFVEIVELFR